MKSSIFYVLILFLFIAPCNGQPIDASIEPSKGKLISKMESFREVQDCFASEQIYPQTAWMWSQGWISAYNYLYPSTPKTSSPELYFKHEDLISYKAKNATGVLLYYILFNDRETIPSLAMVNTSNCQQMECTNGRCILVSRYDPWHEFSDKDNYITHEELEKYKGYWADTDKEGDAYILVKGYNYTWKNLEKLSDSLGGIRVKYGARTIEASESNEYGNENLGITGNIVACNVLIGWVKNTSFEDALGATNLEDLDFAKPCPAYCGEQ